MSISREDSKKQPFLTVKDSNTGKIKRIVFPSDAQIGLSDDPTSLQIFGSLCLGTKLFNASSVNDSYKIDNATTILEVSNDGSIASGSSINIYMPPRPRTGHLIFVKDASGTSVRSPVIVSGLNGVTIDDQAAQMISASYSSLAMYWSTQNQWRLLFKNDQGVSSGSSASGAATNLSFITVNSEASLTNERRLTGSLNVSFTDNGAGSTFVPDLTTTGVVSGTYTFATINVDNRGRILSASNGNESLFGTRLIRKEVFYTGSLYQLYDGNNTLVSSSGGVSTWTIQADGKLYRLVTVGGGGGGGTGCINTNGYGGTGAGGGHHGDQFYSRGIMSMQSPATITVATGGLGGAAPAAGTANIDGRAGVGGGWSIFGTLQVSFGGGAGNGPRGAAGTSTTNSGGSGGGSLSSGSVGDTTNRNGGAPGHSTTGFGVGGGGGATESAILSAGVGNRGYASEYGGAGGGGAAFGNEGLNSKGGAGGNSNFGGGGGGGGGGTNNVSTNGGGGHGGSSGWIIQVNSSGVPITSGSGGIGSVAILATGTNGTTGSKGNDGDLVEFTNSGAGGGGGRGSVVVSNTQPVAGSGGDGGFPGGGGGGGGAGSVVSSGGTASIRVGSGGKGGDGVVVVFTYG